MLITSHLRGIWSMIQAVSSLWITPEKPYITTTKVALLRKFSFGQIQLCVCPLCVIEGVGGARDKPHNFCWDFSRATFVVHKARQPI